MRSAVPAAYGTAMGHIAKGVAEHWQQKTFPGVEIEFWALLGKGWCSWTQK